MAPTSTDSRTGTLKLGNPALFRQSAYIDGQWVDARSGKTIDVDNPATGEIVGSVPKMGAAETKEAIDAANRAFASWKKKTGKERAAVLRRWYELMVEHQEDLARLMTVEQGKPLTESRGEVLYAAAFLEWFGEEAKRIYGDTIPGHQADKRIVVIKQPIGVVAAITPWNFPLAMITRKAGPALAAGCTVVLKPASQTPFSALALAELAERAGVPAGVFNIVTGSASEIGGELTSNPIVRKLSFTGSTEVGRTLMAQCATTIKKLSLELGGNAPLIVFDDADLDTAVDGVMASKYRNTGQTCVTVNRIYVQDSIYDAFAAKLAARVNTLNPANGLEADATQGPLIDDKAVSKVEEHIQDAVKQGASVAAGGQRHSLGGRFFQPTVLTGVTPAMMISREETFGPVAPLFRFKTEEEAVHLANDTEFGLAAYFFGQNIGRVWRVAEALEAGMVGINTGLISTEVAPFGGIKESGLGREGSKYGIDDFVEIKYLCIGGIQRPRFGALTGLIAQTMANLGYVGLGAMGARMVERLLSKGHSVIGYNRTKAKAQALIDKGMKWGDTPRAVAEGSDIVFAMVTDSAALESVTAGADGIVEGLGAGKVLIDMSTVSPAASRALAEKIRGRGADMVDSPVSGSILTLEQGKLTMMVGGNAETFERVKPLLLDIGMKATHVGENGKAVSMKIAVNLNLAVQMLAFSEAVLLAEKSGIERKTAVEVLTNSVAASPLLQYRGPFVLNMPDEAWFDMNMMQKDMRLALEMGHRLEVPLPTGSVANEMLTAARAAGLAKKDFAAIFNVLAGMSGVKA